MQVPPAPPEWVLALPQGDYLRALRLLRAALDETQPISYANDLLIYVLQALGRHAEADALKTRRAELEQQRGLADLPPTLRAAIEAAASAASATAIPDRPPAIPELGPDDAAARLSRVVPERRILILGEEHPSPEHRLLGARLIPHLRAAGITHLALETGAQAPLDEARRMGRVTPATGGFSFEPQRASLLRAALAAGLPVIAFDLDLADSAWLQAHPEADLFVERERRMAEHIVERILRPEPTARVLVWVGHGHGQKGTPIKMMADYLWELAAEEPYSTYQLTGPGSRPGVDLLIRHPRPTYTHQRPDWLRQADRHAVAGQVEPSGACLVQLHLAAEGAAGTPVDQLLTDADGRFELLVPAGDYLLRLWSAADERLILSRPLTINGSLADLRLPG